MDAGYTYALYDQAHGQVMLDALKLREMPPQLVPRKIPSGVPMSLSEILEQLKLEEKEIRESQAQLPPLPATSAPPPEPPLFLYAIFSSFESVPTIHAPALVIFAEPHDCGPAHNDSALQTFYEARDLRITEYQARAFETQVPDAHVIRIPHASHYVFRSNEQQVIRKMMLSFLQFESESTYFG